MQGRRDTDREIRARFDRQASATKQRPLPWSLPILMRKTVFFFVSFHRRAMQAWVLFLVSIELALGLTEDEVVKTGTFSDAADRRGQFQQWT